MLPGAANVYNNIILPSISVSLHATVECETLDKGVIPSIHHHNSVCCCVIEPVGCGKAYGHGLGPSQESQTRCFQKTETVPLLIPTKMITGSDGKTILPISDPSLGQLLHRTESFCHLWQPKLNLISKACQDSGLQLRYTLFYKNQ